MNSKLRERLVAGINFICTGWGSLVGFGIGLFVALKFRFYGSGFLPLAAWIFGAYVGQWIGEKVIAVVWDRREGQ
jgi:hypothetical protein